jgi:hypothetical protein
MKHHRYPHNLFVGSEDRLLALHRALAPTQ